MKAIHKIKFGILFLVIAIGGTSCHDLLDELPENRTYVEEIDYSDASNMYASLVGVYSEFASRGWEDIPAVAVRGDDVNHGGEGDQQGFADMDNFKYDEGFWMINSVWKNFYGDIFKFNGAIEEFEKYKEAGVSEGLVNQYIAEATVLRAFCLLQVSRSFGTIMTPETSQPSELYGLELKTKAEVMQYIVAQMQAVRNNLEVTHPGQRADIPGGVNKYTALAVEAIAQLELKNYQGVADATTQIISDGVYELEDNFYQLFKTPGKLNKENILELQYSDFNEGTGDRIGHLFGFYGSQNWTPAVEGAGSGWGFYEPSFKYIKFMLDRGETIRLETSVLFTDRGIAELKKDPAYSSLPSFVSNTTRDGDVINDYARAFFASGKHYLPSVQLIPGRTEYGSNKNYTAIRYAEVLLMHAEALVQGASSNTMTADEAINTVRNRANLANLSGVTLDQVMDEKFAELAMEWGIRFYDMVRLERHDELSYDGRTFTEDKVYLPYPLEQSDALPILKETEQQ
ncbi:RagB/SusD family nutrient uptake outer membrane protein [Carboxylicivirga sp. M1479]|uniref:RagB/SusD family nutrient uptake outer membrane protein n=1 Tax=Carboxylicivirga sp. M1479 TaxID=2594476 RepID=UPI001177404C|nr:RagB/SusD family nutrient uptake outer membrane protein [Carboxylicivirga sp. M1479]TRX72567.1 RagB/SusD family nutrient uptake outer membrane protein [Carboxylicivirga sp. M1479]